MQSGIENPSKSEIISRCGGDENTEWPGRTDKSRTLKNKEKEKWLLYVYCMFDNEVINEFETSS